MTVPETEQLVIVQFIHRGVEHVPPRIDPAEGVFGWNLGDHGRKFLEAEASHLPSLADEPTRGRVRFWGEWEPPSSYVRLPPEASAHRGPTVVHTPYLPPDAESGRRQNTDPLVFGEEFTYSNCQQYKKRRGGGNGPTSLWDLPPGSLVLFGSPMYRPRRFFLDTVLVIGERQPYRPSDEASTGTLFQATVADPLASCGEGRTHARYPGRMWRGFPNGPFSFSPCVPVDRDAPWFPRPELRPVPELAQYVTPGKTQGFKLVHATEPEVKACWEAVVAQVLDADLHLAVAVGSPDSSPRALSSR